MTGHRASGPEATAELRRLRRRVRELECELDQREQELATLLASNSFQLTGPLRWLRRVLTGQRSPVPELPNRVQSPAAEGLPRHLRIRIDNIVPNDSHRVLDLDRSLQQLLSLPVEKGVLPDLASVSGSYCGRHPALGRIATVASRELREELSFDVAVTPVSMAEWRETLSVGSFNYLLIESAWEPEGGWGSGFAGAPDSRRELGALVEHCRSIGLPVVLWAREDAGSLDRIAWLASAVDRTYAVDEEGFKWLTRSVPDATLGLLPPAVQPRLFNPLRSYDLNECRSALGGTVIIDGWWDLLGPWGDDPLPGELGERLRVVDSRSDYSWVRLQDNPAAAHYSLGVVTPLEKSALLRTGAAELFLPNGLAPRWRQSLAMLRTAASGAPIMSASPVGDALPQAPDAAVIRIRTGSVVADIAAAAADPLGLARRVHSGMRQVLVEHSVAARLRQISDDLDIPILDSDAPVRVAHVLVTMRPELLPACLERFRRDLYPERELVVVIHGHRDALGEARRLLRPGEPVALLSAGSERSLGDCLNMAIAHTSAPVWMKLDDDDHYGPHYTSDLMLYRRMTHAQLLGKPPMFLHLQQDGQLYWDRIWAGCANLMHNSEQAGGVQVAGGTLAGDRNVLEAVPFSSTRRGGSDSEFVRRAHEQGFHLVAADGFNFVRFRGTDKNAHTWRVSSQSLRERATLLGAADQIALQAFV